MGLSEEEEGGADRVRKRPGYLFKYSRRGVRVIVGSHIHVACVHASFSPVFSRRFRYRRIEFRVHVEEVHRRRALFVRGRAHMRTFAYACHSLSLSLSLSLSTPSPLGFGGWLRFFLSIFLLDQLRSRGPLLARFVSAYKRLYTSRLSCTHRRGFERACVVRTSAPKEKREKNSKSKAPRGLVIHRRSAPAVRRHYLRVSRHSELLIRPRCRW